MTEAPPSQVAVPRFGSLQFVVAEGIGLRIAMAVVLSLICAAALVALSGHNPLSAFAAIVMGAVQSHPSLASRTIGPRPICWRDRA